MNILVLCDDLWHPGEVIRRGLTPLEKEGFTLDFVCDAKDILTKSMLDDYDVIISAKGNALNCGNASAPWFEDEVTAVMPEDFRAWTEAGGGFIALHAGNTYSMARRPDMASFIGNEFLGHPRQCPIGLEITAEHPVTAGVKNFTFRDEHYQLKMLAEDARPLFDTVSEAGGRQPGGYVREMGKGRLCVLTPGHNCAVLRHPLFQRLLSNAIRWCGKKL
ncbi:MAG: ThuA domain-containing protein [Christensenellales bacterium]|jgi:type 1 glutamine amidotransferase